MHIAKVLALVAAAGTIGFLAHSSGTLSVNGNSVDTDFVTVHDRTYVPLADVAKALKMVVERDGSRYKLVPAGGANQVQGLNGKIGQTLSCGDFTLKVTEVVQGESYARRFSEGNVDGYPAGCKVVAVVIHLKNATRLKQSIDTQGGDLTSLTDTAEHSFTKRDQDGQRAPDLLPGSACDFALMFTNVPGDATPNDLVYVLHSYTLEHGYKDFTFRISLKQDSSQ